MAYSSELCGSKLRSKLGSTLNESASAPISSFARRQLEKMGWREGDGLGKSRHGISTHVRVHKRADEEVGLGREKVKVREAADTWWADSVGDTLARLQNTSTRDERGRKKKKRRKEGKKTTESDGGSDGGGGGRKRILASSSVVRRYTDEELFVATGGARFGMRAQRRAVGKWTRTEGGGLASRLEEEARRKMEWTGRGKARVIITSGSTTTETNVKLREEESAVAEGGMSGTESSPLPSSSSSSSDDDGKETRTKRKRKRKREHGARRDETGGEGVDARIATETVDDAPSTTPPMNEDDVKRTRQGKDKKKTKKKKRKSKDERRAADGGGEECNADAVDAKEASKGNRKKRKKEKTARR